MPIFDYLCKCGALREVLVRSSAELVECKQCGSSMQKQVAGGHSFTFKGEGAYKEKSSAPRKGRRE